MNRPAARTRTRRREVTEARIRAYSRRGNYHSDPETAAALGLPAMVAQGVHAVGPAYGLLLDEWGDAFLDHGELDVKFVGLVTGGDTVEATVSIDGDAATIEVANLTAGRPAVAGRASIARRI